VVEQGGLGGGERQLHRDFPFTKQIFTKADYETKNNVYKFGVANLTKLKKKQRTENRIIRGNNKKNQKIELSQGKTKTAGQTKKHTCQSLFDEQASKTIIFLDNDTHPPYFILPNYVQCVSFQC